MAVLDSMLPLYVETSMCVSRASVNPVDSPLFPPPLPASSSLPSLMVDLVGCCLIVAVADLNVAYSLGIACGTIC